MNEAAALSANGPAAPSVTNSLSTEHPDLVDRVAVTGLEPVSEIAGPSPSRRHRTHDDRLPVGEHAAGGAHAGGVSTDETCCGAGLMSSVQSIERAFAVLRCLTGGPAGVTELADRIEPAEEHGVENAVDVGGAGRGRTGGGRRQLPRRRRHGRDRLGRTPGRTLVAAVGPGWSRWPPPPVKPRVCRSPAASTCCTSIRWTPTTKCRFATGPGRACGRTRSRRGRCLLAFAETTPSRYVTPSGQLRAAHRSSPRPCATGWTRCGGGFAWAFDEYLEGLSSVAAAVRDANGPVVASLHVHGPAYGSPATSTPTKFGDVLVRRRS